MFFSKYRRLRRDVVAHTARDNPSTATKLNLTDLSLGGASYRSPERAIMFGEKVMIIGAVVLAFWAITAGTGRAVRTATMNQGLVTQLGLDMYSTIAIAALAFIVEAFGSAAVILLASSLVGGAFGFLFGLPRMEAFGGSAGYPQTTRTTATGEGAQVVADPARAVAGADVGQQASGSMKTSASEDGQQEPMAQVTTRSSFRMSPALNEIADWLTKIIVGVGLIQASDIGRGFGNVMNFMLTAGMARFPAAGIVVPACMLSGIIGGFILVYLIMTLTVGPEIAIAADDLETPRVQRERRQKELALAEAVRSRQSAIEAISSAEERAQIINEWRRQDVQVLLKPSRQADAAVSDKARNFAAQPLSNCRTLDERRAWAKLNIALGQRMEALDAYRLILSENSMADYNIATEAYLLAVALRQPDAIESFGRRVDMLDNAQPRAVSEQSREVNELGRVNQMLYEPPPKGYEEALRALDDLRSRLRGIIRQGSFHVLLAAALGQQYTHGIKQGKASGELQATVDAALAAIVEAKRLGESEWLRYLADPNHPAKASTAADARDDDLVDLAKLPQIREALDLP
jgi:hypothetical protein